MHPSIQIKSESARGCGYRQPGGIYLVCSGSGITCGLLPFAIERCPCCGAGIKFSRSWTWIEKPRNFMTGECSAPKAHCQQCPIRDGFDDPVGLLWVGEQFYYTPLDFDKEAKEMGISRRIGAIPRNFVLGKTWVWLAHMKTLANPNTVPVRPSPPPEPKGKSKKAQAAYDEAFKIYDRLYHDYEQEKAAYKEWIPGVFRIFKPTAIEYVVRGTESDSEIDDMVKDGITPVKINRIGDTPSMFGDIDMGDIADEVESMLDQQPLSAEQKRRLLISQTRAMLAQAELEPMQDKERTKKLRMLLQELGDNE